MRNLLDCKSSSLQGHEIHVNVNRDLQYLRFYILYSYTSKILYIQRFLHIFLKTFVT